MTVLTIFAYIFATLFLITLSRVITSHAPAYWGLVKVWYLKKKGYTYFPYKRSLKQKTNRR